MRKIVVNEVEYPIEYGYRVIKNFCKETGIEFSDYLQKLAGFDYNKISFEIIEFYACLLKCMINTACNEEKVSNTEIADFFVTNPLQMGAVMRIIMDGMPKAETPEKKEDKKTGKKKGKGLSALI